MAFPTSVFLFFLNACKDFGTDDFAAISQLFYSLVIVIFLARSLAVSLSIISSDSSKYKLCGRRN